MKYNKIKIYSDGGARGNPGPAGIGAVLLNENNETIKQISEYIGEATNNQAEYKALIRALGEAKRVGAREIEVYLDSELIVRQLNREYKVKNSELASLFVKVYNATLDFKKIVFNHIPREKNEAADKLVNIAIDKALK